VEIAGTDFFLDAPKAKAETEEAKAPWLLLENIAAPTTLCGRIIIPSTGSSRPERQMKLLSSCRI
jgi:hypothetical protein